MRPTFVLIIWESHVLPACAADIAALTAPNRTDDGIAAGAALVRHYIPDPAVEVLQETIVAQSAMSQVRLLHEPHRVLPPAEPASNDTAHSMDVLKLRTLDADTIRAGQVVAQSFMTYSDARLKEDIRSLEPDVQDRLSRIGAYVYKYKAELSSATDDEQQRHEHIGLLAQEVLQEFPQAVLRHPDCYLAVDYSQLVPVLIQAQQEQRAESRFHSQQLHDFKCITEKRLHSTEKRLRHVEDTLPNKRAAQECLSVTSSCHGVPPNGKQWLPRDHEVTALLNAIQSSKSGLIGVTAVSGMGGIGKTTLCTMLCNHPATLEAFPDGIYWLVLGEHCHDVTAQLAMLCTELGLQSTKNVQDDIRLCSNALKSKGILLVLDDVWDGQAAAQIQQVADLSAGARVLTSTRDESTVTMLGSESVVTMQTLQRDVSLILLRTYSKWPLTVEADGREVRSIVKKVIKKCGGLPLALAMVGSCLMGQRHRGVSAWQLVLDRLVQARTDGIGAQLPHYKQHRHVYAALEASLNALSDDDEIERFVKQHYTDLAVFDADDDIQLSQLTAMWADGDVALQAVCDMMCARNIITPYCNGVYRMHDLLNAYVRAPGRRISVDRATALLTRCFRKQDCRIVCSNLAAFSMAECGRDWLEYCCEPFDSTRPWPDERTKCIALGAQRGCKFSWGLSDSSDWDVVKFAVSYGMNRDKWGGSPIPYVTDASLCDWFLSRGATPHPWAFTRSVEQCEVMLRHGIDVNIVDRDGLNVMCYVNNASVCDWLLSHGAPPHPVAFSRSVEQCEVILRHGIDVNIVDKNGNNAMYYVTDASLCDWLLSHGATPHPKAYTRNVEQCEVMSRHGVDINILDTDGYDAMCYVAHSAVCDWLLSFGATPHPKAYTRNVKQCEVILRHGVNVNIADGLGRNAFYYCHFLGYCCSDDVAEWLYEHSCRPLPVELAFSHFGPRLIRKYSIAYADICDEHGRDLWTHIHAKKRRVDDVVVRDLQKLFPRQTFVKTDYSDPGLASSKLARFLRYQ
eukprot:TRINITY_DN312_c0_g1_i10.p1 TRINITY_DN312_c0_g1~~TRINITY_DN312_c0_g1_i10.p1  ORF type:complete len:1021 (+),score=173.78 TRINITY_DN312_c0_g1_i10:454-3516(+)